MGGRWLVVAGTEEEHTRYCFDIYDLNGDGVVSREEMLTMLKTSLGRQGLDDDPDEGVKDLIDMTLKKLDKDKDGRVSFEDWSTTVSAEPLMMEAFGPCLPTDRNSTAFMAKVEAENVKKPGELTRIVIKTDNGSFFGPFFYTP